MNIDSESVKASSEETGKVFSEVDTSNTSVAVALEEDEEEEGANDAKAKSEEEKAEAMKQTFVSRLSPTVRMHMELVAENKYNVKSWDVILRELRKVPVNMARPIYEEFFAIYPTAGQYWKQYAESEIEAHNYDRAERIFMRVIRHCPNVELWHCYLNYVVSTKGSKVEFKHEVEEAFELALDNVGLDTKSTPIWMDYLSFLKETLKTLVQPFEISQQQDAMRRVYQRAVVNPMNRLEDIWKEYDTFENERDRNKTLAKKLLGDFAPRYMTARACCRQRENLLDGLRRGALARPSSNDEEELEQVRLWKELVAFEMNNPEKLPTKELYERITFTFNQCLLSLYHYPELWYEAASYQLQANPSSSEKAEAVYKRSLVACPSSLLLHFIYADLLEKNGKVEEARSIYKGLMKIENNPLMNVTYMRFCHRNFGAEAARKVFLASRKGSSHTYHVYIAAADIEFFKNKEPEIARKIFDFGLQKFHKEFSYIYEYLRFALMMNDESNTRSLFERVLDLVPPEESVQVWKLYQEFETKCGNFESLKNLSERMIEKNIGDASNIFGIVERYRFRDLWPCNAETMVSFSGKTGLGSSLESRKDKGKRNALKYIPFGERVNTISDKYPKPLLERLMEYKSEMGILGLNVKLNETVSKFLNDLPKKRWQGAPVDIQRVAKSIMFTPIPQPEANDSGGKKRKAMEFDDDNTQQAPPNDIYRKRQAKMIMGGS